MTTIGILGLIGIGIIIIVTISILYIVSKCGEQSDDESYECDCHYTDITKITKEVE